MSMVQLSPALHNSVKMMKKENVSPYLLSKTESDALVKVFDRAASKKGKEIKAQWD